MFEDNKKSKSSRTPRTTAKSDVGKPEAVCPVPSTADSDPSEDCSFSASVCLESLGAKLDSIIRVLTPFEPCTDAVNKEWDTRGSKQPHPRSSDVKSALDGNGSQTIVEMLQCFHSQLTFIGTTVQDLKQRGSVSKQPTSPATGRQPSQPTSAEIKAVVEALLQAHQVDLCRKLAAELHLASLEQTLAATESGVTGVRLLLDAQLAAAIDDGNSLRRECERLRSKLSHLEDDNKRLRATAERAQSEQRTIIEKASQDRDDVRQRLRVAWQRFEGLDAMLRRAIRSTGERRWSKVREDVLKSTARLFEIQGCEVLLLVEALEFKSLPYDGSRYRWHQDDGPPVLTDQSAAVLLPGWRRVRFK